MLSEKGAILLDKDLKERDPDCVHRHLLLCETVVLGFLVLKAFSNQPENTHIHRRSYCVLGPQWTEKMEHVWHKAPNVSILTKTPHITYSYSLPLIRGGLELNYLYMTLKETKHLQWTPSSWGVQGGRGKRNYKESCWPSQPWHPWNLASGTLADEDAGTHETPHSQLRHWNLQ